MRTAMNQKASLTLNPMMETEWNLIQVNLQCTVNNNKREHL